MQNDRGSALIAVLVALFILIAVFFAIFTLNLTRASLLQRTINETKAAYLAEAGINRFLSIINASAMNWEEILNADTSLLINPRESIEFDISLRGAYFLIKSVGGYKNEKIARFALIGIKPGRRINAAVINCSKQYPLVFAGNSSVIGDIIAGLESVTSGALDGISMPLDSLYDGSIHIVPDNNLPRIDKNIIVYFLSQIRQRAHTPQKFIHGSWVLQDKNDLDGSSCTVIENDLEINSASLVEYANDILIYCRGNVEIKGTTRISGLITVVSEKSICVTSDAILKDVILIAADSITICGDAFFNGQAISGHSIKVSNNARVAYPSLLYTYDSGAFGESRITFSGRSVSSANAVMEPLDEPDRDKISLLAKEATATVSGYLQDWNYSGIEGRFCGTTVSKNYWYSQDRSTYVNWLVDARIDRSGLEFLPILPVSMTPDYGYAIFAIYDK